MKGMAKHFLKKSVYDKVESNNYVSFKNVKRISCKNLCLVFKAIRFLLKLLKGTISHLEIARLSVLLFRSLLTLSGNGLLQDVLYFSWMQACII